MKKVFSLICMAILALSFVACGDDDNVGAAYNRASTISVVKSDVLFSAAAGTGSIQVSSQEPITLSQTSDWCQATLSDEPGVINVSVDDNTNISGRTCMLTIKSGIDSVKVAIQQEGFAFQIQSGGNELVFSSDDAQRISYGLVCNASPRIYTTSDWLTIETTADSLIINATENTTGHLRAGYVKYEYGDLKDSIYVAQYDFDKDIAGDYRFTFYSSGKWSYISSKLYKDGDSYFIDIPAYNWTLPVSFNESTCQLKVSAGQYMGEYTYSGATTYVYSVIGSTPAGKVTYANAAMVASFDYDSTNGTYAQFVDDGSWGSYVADNIAFYIFKTKAATSANGNRIGSLFKLQSPYLFKK